MIREYILYAFNSFIFVEVSFYDLGYGLSLLMLHVYLESKYIMMSSGAFYVSIRLVDWWWYFFHTLANFLSIASINYWKRGIKVPNYNCGLVYLSIQLCWVLPQVLWSCYMVHTHLRLLCLLHIFLCSDV